MNNKLSQIINLINKTGDKIIVVNEQVEPQFIIMGIEDYKQMLSDKCNLTALTEDELLTKINRDIAIWKSEQRDDDFDNIVENLNTNINKITTESEREDKDDDDDKEKYYFEPIDEEEEDFYELND